jgi:serine protease Do
MKAHGLKYLAIGLLLTLVVLPGHGRERAPGARPQAEKPQAAAPAPCEKVKIEPGSIDLCSIDLDHIHVNVSRAMQDAEQALADAEVQAELADVENLDVEGLADLSQDTKVLAMLQEAPEVTQESGDSGNVFFYSTDSADGSGWLGVTIAEVSAEKVKELKLPAERGALITAVDTDSPAGKAGLKSGDVITELGGQRIEGAAQFSRMVRETPPGRVMPLTVWRDGRAQAISATLARRASRRTGGHFSWPDGEMHIPMPPMPPMPPMGAMGEIFAPRTPRLGIDAEDLSGDLGKYFGAPDGEGVLVREVRSGSPAEKAGLKAGDVIVKVAGERVRTSSDLRASLRAKRESKTVEVVVLRKGTEMTVPVEIEQVTPPEGRRVARRIAA